MRAPFILQVFATHLNSIVGAMDVPSLEVTVGDVDHDKDVCAGVKYLPRGALALTAAAVCIFLCTLTKYAKHSQVERTLQLWADGEMKPGAEPVKRQSNKPAIKATTKINPQTGIMSSITSLFSAENWGVATSQYVTSIRKMEPGSLEEIMELATPFMSPLKSRRRLEKASASSLHKDDEDERACLMDVWCIYVFTRVFLFADDYNS